MIKRVPEIVSRITIGYVFIESGTGKFKDMPKVVAYFESLEIPFASIQAPMVSSMEIIFGFFVLVGFFTRLSSLPLIGIMGVALLTAKLKEISNFSDLIGLSEFLYIVILIWLVAHGSEFLSVDHFRLTKKRK